MRNPETIFLKQSGIEVSVIPSRGALISSIKFEGNEVLFCDPELDLEASSWPSCGVPVLFPFAGRVFKDGIQGSYMVRDKDYNMPLHGFGYGLPWDVLEKSESSVCLELMGSDLTAALYPWNFRAILKLSISERKLKSSIEVQNLGYSGSETEKVPMPCYPGVHPYFAVYSDKFNISLEGNNRRFDVTGTGSIGKDREMNQSETLTLETEYLRNAIIEHKDNSNVKIETSGLSYNLTSKASKYTVLWSGDQKKYQCVEPWTGVPDAASFSKLGTELEGKHPLSAPLINEGESFVFDYVLEF